LHGFFMVAHGPSVDAIALEHLGEDRMHEYGRIRGWESLAYAAGCLGFGALLQAFGMGWSMPIYALATLAILAWSTTLVRDAGRPLARSGRLGAVGEVFREAPRFWAFLLSVFLVWTGFNAAWNFIGLKIDDAGGGPLLIGLGTALGGLIELPTMRSSSRLQARFSLRAIYAAGCIVYATGFALWGAVTDATALSFLTMLEGVGFSLLFTTGIVVVGRLLPSHLYSTGSAVSSMVGFGLGPIVGGVLGGYVYEHFGAAYSYAGASVLALGGAVVAWFALATPALRARAVAAPPLEQPDGPLP
jgi:PPP family 3-phenylpropionic acid transporter